MTLWVTLAAMLLGVNLVRTLGRGVAVATGLIVMLTAAAAIGWLPAQGWWRFAAGVALAGMIVVIWHRLLLCGRTRRMTLGLLVVAAGVSGIVALLHEAGTPPASPLVWVTAFLVLAEPGTRLLRWGLGFVGTPPPAVSDTYGRGEAIGVLERWIALIVIVRGNYTAMAFIIAAKALARHQRFERDPDFAEYFLVGTLASLLMAIVVAESARALLAGD